MHFQAAIEENQFCDCLLSDLQGLKNIIQNYG